MAAIRIIDDHLELANIGSNTHAQIDSHIANISNPHVVTKAQVGLGSVVDGAEINVQSDWNAVAGDALILNKPSDITDLSGHSVTELSDITGAGSGIVISGAERAKLGGIETGATADQTKADIDGLGLSHDSLVDVSVNDHHNELHSVASHNDTTATGAQLDTLTDNSIADTLHRHSELVASDGSPDPALWINAIGNVILENASDTRIYIQTTSVGGGAGFDIKKSDSSWSWRITGEATGFKIRDHLNGLNKFYIEDGATGNVWFDNIKNVGIGTATPATSALLDLTSILGALLLTRMTTTQKNALTAVNGMVLYDSTLNKFQGRQAGSWQNMI
jgi:hypothetical protein